MADISAAIQQLSQEQRKLFKNKLMQSLREFMEKFEEKIKKDMESPYVILAGEKIQKNLRQFIPYTEEAWKEEMEKDKRLKALKKDKDGGKRLEEANHYLQKHLFGYLEERNTKV